MTITMAWINLLVYMRQMAIFGKYIIILNDIIYTFLKFVVIFLIFVISFTFGFHVLLAEGGGGGNFENFRDSFMKTMMMMSGEYEYGNIFFPDEGQGSPPPFPEVTFAFFAIFFILLSLLLMNLLLSLSVNDVANFVQVASLKKMSMRLKFCLNLERLIKHSAVIWIKKQLRKFKCFKDVDFLKTTLIGEKNKVMKEEKEDPRTRMWKQVITENYREEKKNEIEDMMKILRKDQENMERSMETMMNILKEHRKAIDERLEKENMDRSMETVRTISFMGNLGNFSIVTVLVCFIIQNYFLDNKVDHYQTIIDHKTTENRLLQSSYNSRKQVKKDRIERIDDEVQDLRKDVSKILSLLEKRTQEENLRKLDFDRQWDSCIHIDQAESEPYVRTGSVVRTGLFVHSQSSNPTIRKTWPLGADDRRRRSLHI